MAELEEWLGRLVGQFRLQGTVSVAVGGGIGSRTSAGLDTSGFGSARCTGGQCYLESEPSGVAQCTSVGTGPGVLCGIDVPWPQFTWDQVIPSARLQGEVRISGPNLEGARILYGIDPDNLGIRLLMADGKSLAVEALGYLEGEWVVFTTRCVNHGDDTCKWEFRIRIRDDGRPIEMQFKASEVRRPVPWSKYSFMMRRSVPGQEHEAPSASGASAMPGVERE